MRLGEAGEGRAQQTGSLAVAMLQKPVAMCSALSSSESGQEETFGYLDDGRLSIDNSDRSAAIAYTLVETVKLNGADP